MIALSQPQNKKTVIQARGVTVGFSQNNVLEDLDIDVYAGEILGVVGASGTGKSVLTRAILGLLPKRAGEVEILGCNHAIAAPEQILATDRNLGVLFQHGALISSLTVIQNIQISMRAFYDINQRLMDELALMKMELAGLALDAAHKYPSELSGGMIKRAGIARALSLDPEILFLDEPTSGLDPIGAEEFDQLILNLRETLGVTVYMVTHDLDSLYSTCDRIAVLGNKKVLVSGTPEEMFEFDHPWVQTYFGGERARRASGSSYSKKRQLLAQQNASISAQNNGNS